jgi:hypothetical protein
MGRILHLWMLVAVPYVYHILESTAFCASTEGSWPSTQRQGREHYLSARNERYINTELRLLLSDGLSSRQLVRQLC